MQEPAKKTNSELKAHTSILQYVGPLGAPAMIRLVEFANNPESVSKEFAPNEGERVPLGDVLTSCNWVLRDKCVKAPRQYKSWLTLFRAPRVGSKRVFLITDEDNPHPRSAQLLLTAQTSLEV